MGLDTSHEAWNGAYSAFMRWRQEIASAAGLPPLDLMEGFYRAIPGSDYQDPKGLNDENAFDDLRKRLPIKWSCLKPSALHILLNHSDCEGEIGWKDCGEIAAELEKLIPALPKEDDAGHIRNWRNKTEQFIKGLRAANKARENLVFH